MLIISGVLSVFFLVLAMEEFIFGPKGVKQNYKTLYRVKTIKPVKKKKLGYQMSYREYLKYSLMGCCGLFLFGLLFFRSLGFSFLFSLLGFFYPRHVISKNIQRNRDLLSVQFREAMFSIANSLKAGSSLENALFRCLKEMKQIYKMHVEKPIVTELEMMTYELKVGNSLNDVLLNFKERTDMEDIASFVSAAIITEQKGGNLSEVLGNVSKMVSDRITIKREIKTLTAGKQAESRLLTIMPLAIVTLLSLIAPSYMAPMYEQPLGKIMLVFGVILIGINYIVGRKIIQIDV